MLKTEQLTLRTYIERKKEKEKEKRTSEGLQLAHSMHVYIRVYPLTSKGGFLVASPTSRLVMGSDSFFSSSSSGTSLGEWRNGGMDT